MTLKNFIASALAAGLLLPILGACASHPAETPSADPADPTDHQTKEPETEVDPVAVEYSSSTLDAASPVQGEEMSDEFIRSASSFGFQLLRECKPEGNTMISPLSILYALGMTANGAAGETGKQMENVLFGGISTEQANRYFRGFADTLPDSDKVSLSLANSIWLNRLRGDFSVNAEFLSANTSYYDAGIFGVPFGEDALGQINRWVSEKTDGMIPKTLNELDPAALMVLINTVLFDGKWEKEYEDHAVGQYNFTSYDGTEAKREMLSSTENLHFRLGNGTGFIRPYAEKYSFVGVLPDEGEDIFRYAASLDGAEFVKAVQGADRGTVYVRIPSFTFDYSVELSDALKALGMTDAFSGSEADFSRMGECAQNIYISEVLHKTRIELTRTGTKAAAVTAVMVKTTAFRPEEEPLRIYLDRPFFFAIVDNETALPVFCGIVSELK